ERLVKVLGNPATCPHGNPIPGSGAPPVQAAPLAAATQGQRVRLVRVTEQVEFDLEALTYLDEHGFIPGAEATIARRGADGDLMLETQDGRLTIGAALAQQLYF